MAEIAEQPREVVDPFAALTNLHNERQLQQSGTAPEKKEEEKPVDPITPPVNEEIKIDEKQPTESEITALKEEAKTLGLEETATKEQIETAKSEKLKVEAKELGLAETATADEIAAAKDAKAAQPIEFKLTDIEDAVEPEDGTWAAVAKQEGFKIDKDFKDYSYDDFKAALTAKHQQELQEAKTLSKEALFTGLDPKTATALKLLEMGVPEEHILQPTKQVDTYLAMDDIALNRADLEAMKMTPEMIDKEMEIRTAAGTIKHEADKLRLMLGQQKEQITKETQEYAQQWESKKEQALLAQQEQSKIQFKEAMNAVSKFMDIDVPQEIKEAVIRKYNNGTYKDVLTQPDAQAQYILFKELQHKIIPALKSAAFSKGAESQRKESLNIPVTNNNAGSSQQPITSNPDDPFSAIVERQKQRGFA